MPTKERRSELKRRGLCYNCAGKTDNPGTMCEKCLKRFRQKSAEFRKKYTKEGRCIRCGGILEDTAIKKCPTCSLERHMLPFMQYPGELNRR